MLTYKTYIPSNLSTSVSFPPKKYGAVNQVNSICYR